MTVRAWCALVASGLAAACGDGSVEPPIPAMLNVYPASATLVALGDTVRYSASLLDDAGQAIPDAAVQWTTADPTVAVVDAGGLVSALANGTTVVSATSAGVSGTATVIVAQVAAQISVEPDSVTLDALGDTLRLTARAEDRNGNPIAGTTFDWSSSNASAVAINANGLATAKANGTAVVSATSAGVSGTATVIVAQVAAQISVEPDSVTLDALGDTLRLTARAEDRNGNPIAGTTFDWSSSNASAVAINANGLATAKANGTAVVSATSAGVSGTATVIVAQVAAQISVEPDSVTLGALGDTLRLTARAEDRNGHPVAGPTFNWSSSNASAVVIDANGLVTAVSNGATEVTASTGGTSGSATITVRQAPAELQVVAGGGQTARAGNMLREAVSVVVEDGGGSPVAGAEVAFQPADGHGSVDPASTVSDSVGRASTIWTLGEQPGTQTLVVAVGDVTGEVSAEALAPLPVVSFADTTVSAAEGGTVRLAVSVSPPPSSPMSVRYELVADEDPETSDADEADYVHQRTGSLQFTPATPTSTIEVTLRDDDEIEPPRETFIVRLLASEDVYELGTSSAVVEIEEGVCDRTPEVVEAILSSTGQADCAAVTPEHLAGVRELRVSHDSHFRNLTSLRAGDFSGFSNLRELFLQHSLARKQSGTPGLTELPEGVFAGLVNLEWLWMDAHSLTRLPRDTFTDLSKLTYLFLHENSFRELPANMFAGLAALERLTLYGTRSAVGMLETTVKTVDEDAFAGLPNLGSLQLASNQLNELPGGVFRGLDNLHSLELSHNDLRRLPDDIFADLSKLQVLSLWKNQLAEIPRDLFAGLSELKDLDLSENRLTRLPAGIFAGLRSLEGLTLAGNPGVPFEFTLQLARVDESDRLAPGPATVALTVAEGTPVPVALPLYVSNGSASDTVLTLTPGATAGDGVTVVRTSTDSHATYLDLGDGPFVPSQMGIVFRVGDPLVLFANTRNSPPSALGMIPSHVLQAGGQRASVDLASYFADPDGDELAYEVRSGSSLIDAGVSGDQVTLTPHQEGESTLVLMAQDSEGFFALQHARVVVLPAPDPDNFNIDVVFTGHRSEHMDRMVRESAQRWMRVITGDLPDVPLSGNVSPPSTRCYVEEGEYRFYGTVDDILVFVGIEEPYGGVAGRGGACRLRNSSLLPYVGGIRINPQYDSRTVNPPATQVATHEFAHALGFGVIWYEKGFLKSPTWRDGLGADTHFDGPSAVQAFDAAGGTNYTKSSKVPVDNSISPNSHWRQTYEPDIEPHGVFQKELMSTFGGPHLSAVTVQSFADLGYEVDVTKADPYRLYNGAADGATAAMVAQDTVGEERLDFANDVHLGFLAIADENGNIVRVIRR